MEFVPDRDGMAWLSAYLPADAAAGIWERATAAARALQGPAEPRTLPQLRADVTATWLLTTGSADASADGDGEGDGAGTAGSGTTGADGDGAAAGNSATTVGGPAGPGGGVPSPRAQVLVTVPVLSLLGLTEEPAVLDGYGPIPPSMARRLVAEGSDSFHRVLIDPRDGAPLEIGRTSYRLTKPQRQWLRLRDSTCTFPGCRNPSLDNDADHILAWAAGGTTGIANLGQLCRKHHRLKHGTAWTPSGASKDHTPGWTSPTGRHYPSEHPDWEPPHWPAHIPADTPRSWVADEPDRFDLDTEPELRTGQDPLPEQDARYGPEPELPTDPFPDWYLFASGHSFPGWRPVPAAETVDESWAAPLDDPVPENHLLQSA
ncbi:hypothetical protein QFZ65_002056 [Arthrobacter sp. B3I9]|nr:hypothetical protein [Arthrobacter sp. B3I9]